MALEYHKAKPVSLPAAGYDERWLQEKISDDPSILGLGDVNLIQRERKQAPGGRVDFLLYDPEINTMYEVEVMLGQLDESHIIRTIEYWDVERRRWPNRDHRAVIVAEDITNRFFNVIGLMNRSIPIIAIQLAAFEIEGKIIMTFTKVLDIYEPPEGEEVDDQPADRAWWKRRTNPQSLKIVDECVVLLSEGGKAPRVTYNKYHIAIGGSRQNFAWFHPRKIQSHCHLHLKTGEANIEKMSEELEGLGLSVARHKRDIIRLIITPTQLEQHRELLRKILTTAAEAVGGRT